MEELLEIGKNCDAAIAARDEESLESIITTLKQKLNTSTEYAEILNLTYFMGNAYSGLSQIQNIQADGWRSQNFPTNQSLAIDCFRKAINIASAYPNSDTSQIHTNLANELAHQRRGIEAIDLWQPDFEKSNEPAFVSARSRSKELLWQSYWLDDQNHRQLFQVEAYKQLKQIHTHEEQCPYPELIAAIKRDEELNSLQKFGNEHFSGTLDWETHFKRDKSKSKSEIRYREWCLNRRFFLNPINSIATRPIADHDILQFPSHLVKVNDGPYLSAAFSALKRSYCFSRYLTYEGIHLIHPEYESDRLYLTDTLDGVDYSGPTEKLKTAFLLSFKAFDNIAFLLNAYYKRNATSVAFSPKWIKEQLSDTPENPFIDALFWLSCDLFDNPKVVADPKNWKAPQPFSAEIRRIRNSLEHGWLHVASETNGIWNKESDFSHRITPEDLQTKTFHLLTLTRAAIFYLCSAVVYNERIHIKSTKRSLKLDIPILGES